MTLRTVLARLNAAGVRLRNDDGNLVVSAQRDRVDGALLEALRGHKAAILELIAPGTGEWWTPPAAITPEMLSLVELTQEEIDRVVAGVPGGARNVQDIYPLAPLQEGIFFHHLMARDGDPYLSASIVAFDSRGRLEAYLAAMQSVADRHDILRTAVVWEGLGEPVQVVWRTAPLPVEEVALDPAEGDVAAQLHARFHPRRHRIDLTRAPMLRLYWAHDAANGRWVLLQLMHHLVDDNTSLRFLHAEIRAHIEGRADELPAPLPFRNFVAQARLGVGRDAHEAYFRALLGDVDEPTAPFGVLDVWGDGSGADEARLEVDGELARRLRARAQELGVSAASVFHLAWARVLARTTGRDDVVFGTVLFGRMQGGAGVSRVMGPFINTLPVRVRPERAGAEAAVRAMHAQLAELMVHEHASLALAQRSSGVQAPAPLFTSLLNYRHGGGAKKGPSAAGAVRQLLSEGRTNYPVSLSVNDAGDGGFAIDADAPASVGAARLCAMMLRAVEGLVDALEMAPALPLHLVDVLPADERRLVVETWNATQADYPRESSVYDLFRAQAARTPEAVAISWRGERVTYAELETRANRLAHALRRRGVGPETRVGIFLPRTPDLVAAMLGVLAAGGAYVPLDPAYPRERLGWMVEDAGVALVITESEIADRLPDGAEPLLLDRERDSIAAEPGDAPESGVVAENLSHVIFTSGSTGRPKGVMIRHSSVIVLLHWLRETISDAERASVLFSTSINFDVSVAEVFGTLCWGGKLVLVENALELATLEEDVAHVSMVPSAAEELLRMGGIPACVRTLNLGGEALPNALAQGLYGLESVEKVGNLYGPTEDTTYSTYYLVPRGADQVLVGALVANTQAYVLDAHLQPVPVGVVGELYLAGDGLSRGYANRPAMTAERFVPCPFGAPGGRMYRVMDRVRRRADGQIEYLGRTDFQVKVRGYRIELGEIEARLAEHPCVRAPVALVREDTPGDRRLVAYYLASEPVAVDALKAHLAERVPAYMVPAAYVAMVAYPHTPNGKIDRRALPAPEGDAYARGGYEAPVGEVETALAGIWSELMGVARVGRRDDFFALGGHSLLAVQVISRVRQALGAQVGIGDLFERPVLADFAYGIEQAGRGELPPIAPADRSAPLPLSFAQQRLWFLDRMEGAGAAYHIPVRLRLRGELDRDALLRALERIVARHEALRTTFPETSGVPEQRVTPAEQSRFHLLEHDLSGDEDAVPELRQLAAEEAGSPFDLARGPLIRGRLIRMAADDHVLLVTMHHVVSDGWSMGVFTRELSALYAAFRRGAPDPLVPLPVQYADYAAWQRRWVDGDVLREQAEYWTATLGGAPALLELPTDRPRPARQDHAGDMVGVDLGEELSAGLKALSQRHGTTLFMTLLSAWSVVLSRLSGQDDVVVGTPSANRGRREIEGLIGFFINTLALRVEMAGSPSVSALLERVKARALGAQQHQDIPFEQVVELLQPARSLSHSPLFQVMFAWQNAADGRLELPGLELVPLRLGGASSAATAKFDLSLTLSEHGERIGGSVTYAAVLFDRATVERYVGYLRRVLEAFVADDAQAVDALPLLPEAERHLVVETWSAGEAAETSDACIHERFEAQAARAPDAIAVVAEDRSLTYAELDARANRLAHHLRRLGVGAEARVGVSLEWGPELVVALLATLKAGGVYVPLDPALPAERLAYMAGDAGTCAVVTRAALAGRFGAGVTVRVDDDAAQIAAESGDAPALDVSPRNAAYVIYTSGSTGQPKGVAVEHYAAAAHFAAMARTLEIMAGDRVLQFASSGFDVSLEQVLVPLLGGATLVLRGPEPWSPAEFAARAASLGVTVANVPPAYWQEVLAAGAPPRVRLLLVGGDALPAAAAAAGGGTRLLNCYGPTEAVVTATTFAVPAGFSARYAGTTAPIGRPLPGRRAYVLDRCGNPVPTGVAGELHLGGVLARGYLGRPGITAERFVPDPFSAEPGARLYRTGDLARWGADGTLEFLGRNDFQVKVRGFRIELGEIEARLREQSMVRDAVVVARDEGSGGRRLVAYYTSDAALDAAELRARLGERLPEHMLPAAYVRLDALPLTPNGKIDRAALPVPGGAVHAARAYEPPQGEVETALAEIWREVLGVERVGRGDHFFELGGHSLLAVRVASRVRQALGADVPLGDLFRAPVLADFARGIEAAGRAELPPIEPADRSQPLPLSFAQQRLWFIERMEGAGAAYHIPSRLRLRGELDRDALVRALDRIVERHEALRTTFVEVDGIPEQRISGESGFHLLDHDLTGVDDVLAELRRLAAEEAGSPFDLATGPLIRGRLIRLAADDHVLLVTMHHVVSDGWSAGVFTRELSALYGAFRRGAPDPLVPLPVQYADYAAWQRRWVDGEVLREQAEYWRKRLGGAPELLELPADRPRPARHDPAGGVVTIDLGDELSAGVKALSQRHGTTLFMTLLAGWSVVLSRLSGQDDVVVGTPSANRGRQEIEGLIGFFINTLALRVEMSGSPSVAEVLERVKARALGAQQHQDIPFEQVVELLQPARSLSHTPLFQVMFAWQSASDSRLELPGLALAPLRLGGAAAGAMAKFDLSLTLSDHGGRIGGSIVYAAALFDRETVERHAGYLRAVLAAMVADDARAVDRLPLLDNAERRLVVEDWNATEAAYPRDVCVHELFEARAADAPNAIAVVGEDRSLTCAELNARANRLAHHLRALGVGPDARVAVHAERSVEMVVGLLGVLKAGGAYVPLDPAYPAERLRHMLEDSAPAAVLTHGAARAAELFAGLDVPVVELDGAAWAHRPDSNPGRAGLTPNHLAYVLYTSGSTGRPKGVMIEHRTLANHTAWQAGEFGIGAGDAVLQRTSISFDASVWELWTPLATGARMVLLPAAAAKDPAGIARVIEERDISIVQFVPALLQAVLGALPAGAPLRPRLVFCGGEPLPRALVTEARARGAGEVVNLYGPTEATIDTTFARCCGDDERAPAIGTPIGNVRVYLLDGAGAPVPVGVTGELYVGGAGLARGYRGRPGMTAERFVPDPFGAEPGARLYRTGDLARRRADGTLEFVGRNDFQVKIRGFRVELGEIEARLREHPQVREAVVLAREDAPGDQRLVAYYVAREPVDAEALRRHAGERLPEHMVPAAYVRLDALPLTPNGKLDRRALPAPDGGAFATRGYEAPAGAVETALAEIWREVLGVERVGRRDHFFELGGHSLLAVRIVSRVREVLGADVPLGELFRAPVLAELARGIEQAGRAELPPIGRADRSAPLPLSFAQQRLWFLERLGGLGNTYHIPSRLRFRGELDRDALVRALDAIVARHEALRTTFVEMDGGPVQRIAAAEESRFHLLEHDLWGDDDALARLRRLAAEEAGSPFELERGPLIRGRLIRMAADDHALLITLHHVVSDGWSMGVLTRELGALYAAFRRGEPDPLAPLPVQYADYAAWQRAWVAGEVLAGQADYWSSTLAGAPELLQLSTDHPRPARQDHAGATLAIDLGDALTAGLKALSRRQGTTLFMTLLAGWAAVLARLSGQDDVVIGTPSANRGRREIEGLIGFFVNTLALRVDLSGSPSVSALLERVKARALEAQQHQDIPFEQVVELLQPVRSLAHTPLFQVMFAWQNAPESRLELPGLALAPPRLDAGAASSAPATFDLSLTLFERGGRIGGSVTYATALFERETIERHLVYLRRALEAIVADDAQAVARIDLLPEAERHLVVEEWNASDAAHPAGLRVHEIFEAQVARAPDAVALVHAGREVTYGDLNARANRLAHRLRGLGVRPDARVAVCVERGPEMIVALLGVLKAGGGYVPLDPAYPDDRMRHVLDDSAPVAMLATAATVSRFASMDIPVVALDAGERWWADEAETNPSHAGIDPHHLAYVIYTSGSTGRPKGVMVEHRSVCQQVAAITSLLELRPGERTLQFASVTFDASVEEIFGALLSGCTLVLRGDDWLDDAGAFWARCQAHGINVMDLPTRFWQLLAADASQPIPACVRRVVIGGEAVEASALAAWFAGDGHRPHLLNTYGPTESTVNATAGEVTEDPAGWRSIGRPVPGTRTYLLDAHGQPVPVGAVGEIHVGGGQVARGYLGRPGLTAERFVPDAFPSSPGARLYRTGDLGRWRADGSIEFAGRNDFQVKIRGFRIEPGEIEARLAEHPSVREAVVLAREGAPGEKRLVAYVVGDATAGADVLRAYLGERLPAYMVPAAFVRLEAWPLTPGGKVDRRRLPAPEGDAFATRGYEPPVGETETALAAIWSELLGVETVGRRDRFFELGGHSLLAVQVISRVRQALGVEVALGDLFERPALADFARGLEEAGRAALPPIEPAERGGALPLSFAQQRLWFIEQLEDTGASYHISSRLRLRGELDRDALARALDRIVERHEALRTTFVEIDGIPEQRIAAASRFHLVEHDLSGDEDAVPALRHLAAEEAGARFDLARGPLIRGRLIRMAADDHVLLVTMHHVVSDGWSAGVFTRELSALYGAFRRGEPDPLVPLPVQYADYAAWQRRWVDGEVLREQAEHWMKTLGGAPGVLELSTDRPRPARQDHAGDLVGIDLGEALTAGLKALSQRHGTTLFMTLLAAWSVVLSRLSGQDDVVVGTPSANRGRREIEGLIGFFINTLALRVEMGGSPSVAEVLARVKARALGAQHHQDIPFEQVVELLQPARSLSHTPLFQVMFAWQNAPEGRLELPGLALAPLRLGGASSSVTAKFDLSLTLSEHGGRIGGSVTYATSLFDRATVERHVAYLRRVLEAFVSDDLQAVDALPLLPEAERRLVVEEWSAGDAAEPSDACIHERFEAQARARPDDIALAHAGGELTYAELDAQANRLAHHLRRLGVGPEARVGISLEWSPELVVALLATLKAGGVYVPLDPALPAERLAYMAEDAGTCALVTRTALAGRVGAAVTVWVDDDADRIAAERNDAPAAGVSPRNAAYVIYTSGSTGRPKGVAVEHGAAAAHFAAMARTLEIVPGDRVLQFASSGFDVSLEQVFVPLLGGATLVLRGTEPWSPAEFAARAASLGVTVANLPPAYWQEVLAVGALPAVRLLLVGGDALPAAAAAAGRGMRLLNGYGPTETVVTATAFAVPTGFAERFAGATAPIGRPLSGRSAYVLDPRGNPVPTGVAGELYLGGLLARGYLGRPGMTAERFVPDPFSAEPGARLYRTGDRVRWSADGTLEFLGRNDFQVKVRGFRIELGEIEARLREQAGVRDAVVAARDDAPGVRRLVAYYTSEAALDTAELRARLGERLPEHMLPAAYVRLDALPLTPNGKVDRRALPAPDGGAYATRGYEAPRGEVETALAEIWREVLGVERVGRGDHFFELGGHSLLAVRIVSRVRQALGADVPLGELFRAPVLADFARDIEAAGGAELPPIERVDRAGRLPLSFAQQRLWFIERMEGAGAAYHIPSRLRLRGELDRDALVRALDRIVARHEALRTTFVETDGIPEQRIAAESQFHLLEHDLTEEGDVLAELRRLSAEEAGSPFDLARGPLIRGRLIRLAADDHVLLVTMHHVVSDGWSAGVFTRELSALYGAFRRGEPDPLAPLPVQYADYAAWQRRWVDGEVLREQAEYWKMMLSGAPELLELPADRPRPARQDTAGGVVTIDLGDELSAGVKALSQRHGTTLFMTLLSGWAVVLSRLSGQEDVVVGTPSANRGRQEIEGLIGFFVNTLALHVEMAGSPSVAEVLARVKARALGAQQHQDIPFEQVVELLQPARSLSHTPLFQVMFAWQNAPEGRLELPGLALAPLRLGGAVAGVTAKFDLSLALSEIGGRIGGSITYATALFDAATVARHVGYLRAVLRAMVADDAQSVDRLPLLDDAERHLVVEDWNATQADYPRGASVYDLFRAQAARTPEAIAISWRGERVTYAELETRANQLAHALRRRGVGPETRVGIFLPRTPDLVAAILGVLAAGGAYVPLDPAYPRERLGWMVEDAGVALVITESDIADRLPDGAVALLLDRERDSIAAESDDAPESGVVAENLSHVIFTSGSTGRPKGVMIRHSSVIVLLHWLRETISEAERASVLFSTSINFDVSVAEVFGTLCWGGKLVLVENALELATLEEEVAHVSMVPSAAEELLRMGGIPTCVRTLNLGGEALPNALAQGLYGLKTVEKVGNLYGPTEDTTYSTYYLVPRGADQVLVGAPVANTQAYVLDAHLQPVPVGVVGELYLAGDGLSRGYANRSAMTAERFVPCPFGAPGGRMYRVMDRVRRRADGQIEYLGRTDFQVKVRGYRIELGEIEARLAEHPGVRAPVVLVREDTPGDRRLVAYYLADEPVAVDALKAHLADRLPAYMVPAAYVAMVAYPHTPNGKIDRRALPAPEGGAYSRGGYEAPVGEIETALAEIWSELLGVDPVGRRDQFFELGGHSLLAVQIVSRVRQVLGAKVTIGDLFERPVLADFARGLRGDKTDAAEASSERGVDEPVAVRAAGSERPLFLVHDGYGSIQYAQVLAPQLGAEMPVHALPPLLDAAFPLRTIPAMAERLVRMIRSVQPSGPYRIAGYSFGGLLAYEAAAQLLGLGQEIEFLGLIDTADPVAAGHGPRPATPTAAQLLRVLCTREGTGASPDAAIRELAAASDATDPGALLRAAHEAGLLAEPVPAETVIKLQQELWIYPQAQHDYAPPAISIPISYFQAEESSGADPCGGWRAVVGDSPVRVIPIPGTHWTMVEAEHIPALGQALSRELTRAAKRARAPRHAIAR